MESSEVRARDRSLDFVKKRIGPTGRKGIRITINFWLWLVSWAPAHTLRVAGLRLCGAKIGADVALCRGFKVLDPWNLSIGAHSIIGVHAWLDARGGLSIGSNCNLAAEIAIWTAGHDIQSPDFAMTTGAVSIGDRAWICHRATLLPGTDVGEGSVVANGAVVTKAVPPYALAAGVPARIVGTRTKRLEYQLGRKAL